MATRQLDNVEEAVDELDEAVSQSIEDIDRDDLAVPAVASMNEWREPWERRDDESEYAWAMFCHFRDLGAKRTHMQVVEYAIHGLKRWDESKKGVPDDIYLNRRRREVSNLGSRKEWAKRIFAYDAEQERLYQIARSEAIREMAERHEIAIEKAISGLLVPIDALEIAMRDPEFVKSLSEKNASKLIDLANRASRTIPTLMSAERLSRGMPTEISGGKIEHEVIHRVERDHIGEVLAALGQARIVDDGGTGFGSGEVIDAEVVEVHSVSAEGDDN